MNFSTNVDIANRGLQHIGISRIADFTEDSLAASETNFVYDKLRRAELRRNTWVFSIKRAAIRAITTGTMFVSPALWASTTTYGIGAIVQDSNGRLWQSKTQTNLNNAPGNSAAWDTYCGPMTAAPYDTTGQTGYFAGELVYETPGDGSYVVWMSLLSSNGQDPRQPTQWIDDTQYSKTQVVQWHAAWAVGTTYAAGAVTRYTDDLYYVSLAGSNLAHIPSSSPTWWTALPTTLAPGYFSTDTAYTIGQFVTYGGLIYVCVLASTGNLPTNATYFAAVATGTTYASLIDFNLNNDPSAAPALWAIGTTYNAADTVGASDGFIYSSIAGSNIGNDPTTTSGFWTNTGTLNPWSTTNPYGTAANQWVTLNVGLTDAQVVYPIGSGPASQAETRNVYRLPANFLRRAAQDPKAGSASIFGSPTNLTYDDWILENGYLVSSDSSAIVLRFVADITDVTAMDDLFCEGLAARIGLETCERLTQSTAKLQAVGLMYKEFMGSARTVNAIEVGSDEPPLDDWIATRV